MNVLAFCFFPAFTPPKSGGESRLFNFYRHLSEHHQVTLLTSAGPHDQEQTIHHGANFVERRIPKDEHFARQWQRLQSVSSGGDLSAPCLAACGQYPSRLHEAYLEEYEGADIIVHDFPFTIDYDIFLGLDDKPRAYNAHNCESRLYEALHPEATSAPIHELVRDVETRLLNQVDMLLYCSEDDLTHFRAMTPDAGFEAVYAPHGIEPVRLPARDTAASGSMRALFIGSAHGPNALAARFIVETLAPVLTHVQFDVVGNCLPEGRYPLNVHRHGVVDEPTKLGLMAQADVALNPMASGSGANMKVLDYLASGLPVLSTPFGMRGIDATEGKDYFCATLDQFPDVLDQLSKDPGRCVEVGQAGRHHAMQFYTWTAIAQRMASVFVDAVEKAQAKSTNFVMALNDYDSFASVGGGGTRTKGLYQAVSAWMPVVFLCFSQDDRLRVRHEQDGITVIAVPKTPEHQHEQTRLAARFHISVDDIVASHHCVDNFFLDAIYRTLRKHARRIVLEHCYLLPLPVRYGDRYVYSSHNDETRMKAALLRGHVDYASLMERMESLERYAVENAAMMLCVSYEDAASLMVGKRASAPAIVIRNGASEPADEDVVQTALTQLPHPVSPRSVVFLGSAHGPNVEAAHQLIRHVAPGCPDVQFHFVGSVCNAIHERRDNVQLWGVVDEARKCAILQSCPVALNPVVSGGGSNIKMADYIANGLFVITTDFGVRGYPEAVCRHILAEPLENFPQAIQASLADATLHTDSVKAARKADFRQYLSMRSLGEDFVRQLKGLETPRKRVLFVAYRYTSPALGGAEIHMDRLLSGLAHSGHFDIDVIAPEISHIDNRFRFSEAYGFDAECAAPAGLPNLRFARFVATPPDAQLVHRRLSGIWSTQPRFERVLSSLLRNRYQQAGLTWGWAEPEGQGKAAVRWGMTECAAYLPHDTHLVLHGHAPQSMSMAISNNGTIIDHRSLTGKFALDLTVNAGELVMTSSQRQLDDDPRPLGFLLTELVVGDDAVAISDDTLMKRTLATCDASDIYALMDQAAEQSRTASGVRLTDSRGPWSRGMEAFIRDNVSSYDLVVTNNNVFRPAVFAINEARRHNIPSILIPHAHLDDDFYHFPDLRQSEKAASLVLASPEGTATFLRSRGCNAMYLPAGCDAEESFSQDDERAFRKVHASDRPFVLVLGRKSGAKGYMAVIDAVGQLNQQGIALDVVLIGPDDDGRAVDAPHARYLGRQPREVVRGALLASLALCNMSSSESFGIVLLEAWLAGKAVIANQRCAAFRDLVKDGENGLLADQASLSQAIRRVYQDADWRQTLAVAGRATAHAHGWTAIQSRFTQICLDMTGANNAGSR